MKEPLLKLMLEKQLNVQVVLKRGKNTFLGKIKTMVKMLKIKITTIIIKKKQKINLKKRETLILKHLVM